MLSGCYNKRVKDPVGGIKGKSLTILPGTIKLSGSALKLFPANSRTGLNEADERVERCAGLLTDDCFQSADFFDFFRLSFPDN